MKRWVWVAVVLLGGCGNGSAERADAGQQADGAPSDAASSDVGPSDVGPFDVGPFDAATGDPDAEPSAADGFGAGDGFGSGDGPLFVRDAEPDAGHDDAAVADGGPCGPPARLGPTLPGTNSIALPVNMVLYVEAIGLAHYPATAQQSDLQGGNSVPVTVVGLGSDLLMVTPDPSGGSGSVFDIAVPNYGVQTRVQVSVSGAGATDEIPPTFTSSLALTVAPYAGLESCGRALYYVTATFQQGTDGPDLPGSYGRPLAYVLYLMSPTGGRRPTASKLASSVPGAEEAIVLPAGGGRQCYVVGAWDIAGHETVDPTPACIDVPE